MRAVEFVSESLRVKESQDWQGNRGILQAETTDHTLEEAEQYVKTNYPVFKKYRVRRAEPGFRANFDSSQFARGHAHVHDVDSAMDYLQLQENPVMSGSWQHSYSIGYSWHTNENRSSGIAVLYYEDRGMGSDEIIIAAKDRKNLAAAVGVFRDAGVVPQLKKKGVIETTGDNKFDAMMGTMQGNAQLLKSVMAEFLTIYYGALDEEDMTDHIAYNLGDFFNGVKRSRDPVLQKSYAYVRDLAEEDVDVQANGTLRAIRMMLGDPYYTPPPKPPMSTADQDWVTRLVNAMTAALASHGIKAHPNWNKKRGNGAGLGPLKEVTAPPSFHRQLQDRLYRDYASGYGEPFHQGHVDNVIKMADPKKWQEYLQSNGPLSWVTALVNQERKEWKSREVRKNAEIAADLATGKYDKPVPEINQSVAKKLAIWLATQAESHGYDADIEEVLEQTFDAGHTPSGIEFYESSYETFFAYVGLLPGNKLTKPILMHSDAAGEMETVNKHKGAIYNISGPHNGEAILTRMTGPRYGPIPVNIPNDPNTPIYELDAGHGDDDNEGQNWEVIAKDPDPNKLLGLLLDLLWGRTN